MFAHPLRLVLMLVMIFAPSTPAWSVYVLSVGGACTSTLVHIVIICAVHIVQWLEGKAIHTSWCDVIVATPKVV